MSKEQEPEDRPVLFYGVGDPEVLTATTVSEAVEQAVDQWPNPPGPDDEIEVTSYRRMALPPRDTIAAWALDEVLERLDEDYGDPDGSTSRKAEASVLHNHALCFADAVRAHYETWACEPVDTFKVRVAEHVPEDWIQHDED